MSNLIDTMNAERERLNASRAAAEAKVVEAQKAVAAIDQDIAAIDAFFQVKEGKAVGGGTGGSVGKRTSRKPEIVSLLASNKNGMTRGDILDALGAKGDKAAEQAVTNALSNMKKKGEVSNADGVYKAA